MKAKSESEVAQSCPTLSDPMDCSPPGSCVHGIVQARVLEWGAIAFSKVSTRAVFSSFFFWLRRIAAQGLSLVAVPGLPIAVASHAVEHGL